MTDTPRKRPRLSLLSLLLLTTVVALALGLILEERRNGRLRERVAALESENRAYHQRLGVLDVSDPTRIHAIREIAPEWEAHRYRVHLPEGREYVVRYQAKGLAGDSPYNGDGFFKVSAGTRLIEVSYEYPTNRSTGVVRPVARLWYPSFDGNAIGSNGGGTLMRTIYFRENWLLTQGQREQGVYTGGSEFVGGVYKRQETREAGESLLLHSRRRLNDKPMEYGGLEVWIEPAPVAESVPPPPGA